MKEIITRTDKFIIYKYGTVYRVHYFTDEGSFKRTCKSFITKNYKRILKLMEGKQMELKIQDVLKKENVGKVYKCRYDDKEYEICKDGKEFWMGTKDGGIFITNMMELSDILETTFKEIKGKVIDWYKVPRGTEILVKDTEKGEWVEREFIAYLGSDIEDSFVCRGVNFPNFANNWCNATIVNPKKEWLLEVN